MKNLTIAIAVFFMAHSSTFAQSEVPKGWHLLDLSKDGFYGISLQQAYDFANQKKLKPTTVIVGVLDSGIDTLHEDLKNILWHNPKEIANNDKDDDGNGYVDDYFGWNFLGNKKGDNIKTDVEEKIRCYYNFKAKFEAANIDTSKLVGYDKYLFDMWKRAAQEIQVSTNDEMELKFVEMAVNGLKKNNEILITELNKPEFTGIELEKFETKTKEGKEAKLKYLTMSKLLEIGMDETNIGILNQFAEYIDGKKRTLDAKNTQPKDIRKEIINDNYNNINDKFYGNNNVFGPTAMHGTHVAGIIAAQRDNNLGANGVAENTKIMAVRVVPDGDEYDKDVALGIFYAVNNGAKVINMSFGKSFSPEKKWVDSAIKYAESKDVLIVHASGNDGSNVDVKYNYPNPYFNDEVGNRSKTFLTVGASTDPKINSKSIVANFSNYGKIGVDVFAPGVKIFSTLPGTNKYGNQQGTSMAAPVVSGIAALLRSYFPGLSAVQIKLAIEKSVVLPFDKDIEIKVGDEKLETKFENISRNPGVVNAYLAFKIAYDLSLQKMLKQ
jgi:cell wall-associated protease